MWREVEVFRQARSSFTAGERHFLLEHLLATFFFVSNKYPESHPFFNETEKRRRVRDVDIVCFENSPENGSIDVTSKGRLSSFSSVSRSSAGIGRTGCFIALSNGMKQLNEERCIDIVRILCDLRRDRGGMIQTNDQYQFVYQALSEYARSFLSTSTFFPSSTDG